MRGSPGIAALRVTPHWCWSSLILAQVAPPSSDRYMPRMPSTWARIWPKL